jgi:general secretion pathway protein K
MISFHQFKQRLNYNPLIQKNKKKGIALILAATSLVMMVYIATEVSKDSLTEYAVNTHELTRIKTYYAARNGMQIALLRVKLFQQASRLPLPPGFSKQLDKIWSFPFAWPLPISKEVNAVDQDAFKKLTQESLMDASYTHSIEDEGSKIDLNDLVSPSKTLQKITKTQILNIFQQKIESDEEFRQAYQSFRFEEIVNHIIDFMSDSTSSADGGGDKKGAFSELGDSYPPNRGFRTIDELRLVPGMSEEFFNLLSSRVTIYGMKAINPNTAPADVLKSLDPMMTDRAVKAALERRNNPEKGGPFSGEGDKCRANYKQFIELNGADRLTADFDKIPMICDKVINFRIKSTGVFGNGKNAMMKNIVAVVIDLGRSASQVKSFLDQEKKAAQEQQGITPPADQKTQTGSKSGADKQEPLPKGPPRVVYWTEY